MQRNAGVGLRSFQPQPLRKKESETHLSTGYPQAIVLNTLEISNWGLTGFWHVLCNIQQSVLAKNESRMSRQRLPAEKQADKPLTSRQLEIVDHILTTGDTVKETAAALNCDRRNIYRTLDYPHVKRYLQQRALDHVGLLAPIAARVQGELLNSDSDHVKATVAENILDRHLGKPVQRQQLALGGRLEVSIDLG